MHWKFICGFLIAQLFVSLGPFPKRASAQETNFIPSASIRYLKPVEGVDLLATQVELTWGIENRSFASTLMPLDGESGKPMIFRSYSAANQPLFDYLASPKVQEQIDLSKEQKNQFTAIRKKLQEGYAELNKRYHQRTDVKASKKIREEMTQEFQKKIKELRSDLEEEVKDTLVPHQVNLIQRMKFQKAVQVFGFSYAISNAPFDEEIRTTEAQRKELAKIKMETEKAIQEKIAEMRKAGKEKMLKTLDKNQRQKIKALEGDTEKKSSERL